MSSPLPASAVPRRCDSRSGSPAPAGCLGTRGLETARHGPGVAGAEAAFPGLNKDEQFGIASGGTCGCFPVLEGVPRLLALGVAVGWRQEKCLGVLGVTTVSVHGDALAWQRRGAAEPGSPCRARVFAVGVMKLLCSLLGSGRPVLVLPVTGVPCPWQPRLRAECYAEWCVPGVGLSTAAHPSCPKGPAAPPRPAPACCRSPWCGPCGSCAAPQPVPPGRRRRRSCSSCSR